MALKKSNDLASAKKDLAAARAELKAFRHDVAVLKKKGLLDKLYDARSVTPTKYLKSQIKRFSNVLSGEATPIKVSKKNQAYYKSKGYAVKSGRVIVPHLPNEKVYSTRGDFRTKTRGAGGSITKIHLKLDEENLLQWVDDLRNSRIKLKPDEQLQFQLFGYNAYRGFNNTPKRSAQQAMADYLETYDIVSNYAERTTPDQEVIQGITIFRVERDPESEIYPRPTPHPMDYAVVRERKAMSADRRRQAEARRISRMTDEELDEYMQDKSDRKRQYRESMTPAQRARYNEQAKKRMQKMRSNKRAKKIGQA